MKNTFRSILGNVRADAFDAFADETLFTDGEPDPTFKALDERTVEATYGDGSIGLLIWTERHGWDFPEDGGSYAAGYAYACGYRD